MYLLDITYSKIIENVILVDFFNLILSALGVIMFHKEKYHNLQKKVMHSYLVEMMD